MIIREALVVVDLEGRRTRNLVKAGVIGLSLGFSKNGNGPGALSGPRIVYSPCGEAAVVLPADYGCFLLAALASLDLVLAALFLWITRFWAALSRVLKAFFRFSMFLAGSFSERAVLTTERRIVFTPLLRSLAFSAVFILLAADLCVGKHFSLLKNQVKP